MSYPNNSSNSITLNPYPWLVDYSLGQENEYVDLVFSEGVYSAIDSISALEAADFSFTFNQNNGNAIDGSISTLSKTNPARSCGLAFCNIIKQAKNNKEPYVVICEDDIHFVENAKYR